MQRYAIQPTLTPSHGASSSGSKVTDSHLQQLPQLRPQLLSSLIVPQPFSHSLPVSSQPLSSLLLLLRTTSSLSPCPSESVCLSVPLVTSQPVALPSLKLPAWLGPMPSPGWMQPAVLIGRGQKDAPILGQEEAGLR